MISTKAYAAKAASEPLKPFTIERREPKEHDLLINIQYCGICHSDLHQARNEWGGSIFPMVPGHEIIGSVIKIGSKVSKFRIGDTVGVGCFVNSCQKCEPCKNGEQNYCNEVAFTYNGRDNGEPTYGGYSTRITVNENYVLKIPDKISLDGTAPLLCAGITTYRPLKYWQAGPGKKIAIAGLGGLGHMGTKIAKAMGAEVSVLSRGTKKREAALALGADNYYASDDSKTMASLSENFDLILDTISAPHDIDALLNTLKLGGVLVLVGVPPEGVKFNAHNLIAKRRIFAGSLIGSVAETQEMLNFCASKNITAAIELIQIGYVNKAYDRMEKGDVHYRFVIDCTSIN